MEGKNKEIVFGGGCFWCTEAVFSKLRGVKGTTPGYAGGVTKSPTYEQVCNNDTGHAEVLKIDYDSSVIKLEKLLEVFFEMHDPTTPNRQGDDYGNQYRSIVLYSSDEERQVVEKFIANLQKGLDKPIVTEVKRLEKFYPAEEHHQKYYDKNPIQPYCMLVIRPKVAKIKKEFSDIVE